MTKQTNKPSHAVYHVGGEGEKKFWTKIGAAWAHEDGEGFNIHLTCVPVDGRLVVRKPRADEQKGDAQ
jgi:hypothetical protein